MGSFSFGETERRLIILSFFILAYLFLSVLLFCHPLPLGAPQPHRRISGTLQSNIKDKAPGGAGKLRSEADEEFFVNFSDCNELLAIVAPTTWMGPAGGREVMSQAENCSMNCNNLTGQRTRTCYLFISIATPQGRVSHELI